MAEDAARSLVEEPNKVEREDESSSPPVVRLAAPDHQLEDQESDDRTPTVNQINSSFAQSAMVNESPEQAVVDRVSSPSTGEPAVDRPSLFRSPSTPSVLSDGTTSFKPDPPSIIEHQTVDFDWVQEFLPRGGDVAESLPSSAEQQQDYNQESLIFHDYGLISSYSEEEEQQQQQQQQPMIVNVPSTEDQEMDSMNAHHLQRVESLLRDDHVPSSSPLAAVLENEVMIPTPIIDSARKDQANVLGDLAVVSPPTLNHRSARDEGPLQSFPEQTFPLRPSSDPRVYDAPLSNQTTVGQGEDVSILEPTKAVAPRNVERQQQTRSHAFQPTTDLPSFSYGYANQHNILTTPIVVRGSGRRKMRLRLQEEVRPTINKSRRSLLGHLRSRSSQIMWGSRDFKDLGDDSDIPNNQGGSNRAQQASAVDRGTITVSWFDGTSAIELQEHVRASVVRKLGLDKGVELADMRVLDESSDPPEEIVLSPHIPDGSRFLLRYTTRVVTNDGATTPLSIYSGRAPDSPTATPPSNRLIGDLNASQLALLRKQLNALKLPHGKDVSVDEKEMTKSYRRRTEEEKKEVEAPQASDNVEPKPATSDITELEVTRDATVDDDEDDDDDQQSKGSRMLSDLEEDYDDMMLHSEDPIEARLRQITELLILDRQKRRSKYASQRREKRQVIFVLANYFVLFLSLIAISAEIQARAPGWLSSLENQMKNVQNCAENKDALFECVSNGDFAGLVASVLLYLSRSVATRRFFLFGFETPKKLWTVVYESLVTSFCWGFSYLFIRRGLNPDTRPQFVQKYWKDAVYGSLAGFNAAFMKHVLKNLIPQEAVEDVLRERQLKFMSWLPSFHG